MKKIGIIGLGYVGLPLAIEFGKVSKIKIVGFDISSKRINELKKNIDSTNEHSKKEISKAKNTTFTTNADDLNELDYYIVTVPTPISDNCKPDYSFLLSASTLIGKQMKKGSIVIYESTVNPGATEEICVPCLEKFSNYVWKKDFNVAYSPERLVPGSKTHTLRNIDKLVAGDTNEVRNKVAKLYSKILTSKIIKCSSIKVAEAAKVIENTQRDMNIAFFNELSNIFYNLNINTEEVIDAASTKWNFLKFEPGLVGGHCLSVDPYYLIHKARATGYQPKLLESARNVNENLAKNIADRMLSCVSKNKKNLKIAIFGLTYKENCTDTRNSKAFMLGSILSQNKIFSINVDYIDHLADANKVYAEYAVRIKKKPNKNNKYDFIVFLSPHKLYKENHKRILENHLKKNGVVFDLKNLVSTRLSSTYEVLKA
tara:strand:+ start:336 stop:1619 length:1284 start_codon:yes stop_codon:yes gene_type:complete